MHYHLLHLDGCLAETLITDNMDKNMSLSLGSMRNNHEEIWILLFYNTFMNISLYKK